MKEKTRLNMGIAVFLLLFIVSFILYVASGEIIALGLGTFLAFGMMGAIWIGDPEKEKHQRQMEQMKFQAFQEYVRKNPQQQHIFLEDEE